MPQQGKDIPHLSSPVRAVSDKIVKDWWPRVLTMGYRGCYKTGIRTMRLAKRTVRRTKRWARPAGRLLYKVADTVLLRHVRGGGAELKRMAGGFPIAAHRVRNAFSQSPVKGIGQILRLPFLAIRRHRRALCRVCNVAAPAAALAILAFTLQYWGNQHYALALEYDGQEVGYIQDESVFDAAANMAEGRVMDNNGTFALQQSPRLSIAIADQEAVLSETDLCNKLLSMSSDAVAEMVGLYVDGEFEGAVSSQSGMEQALEDVQAVYAAVGEEASFVQDVETREALYPIDALRSVTDMTAYLLEDKTVQTTCTVKKGDTWDTIAKRYETSPEELKQDNPDVDKLKTGLVLQVSYTQPRIQVQVAREEVYTEEIGFKSVTKKSADLYVGQQSVTGGKKGEKSVTAKVLLINGEEISREVLKETVTKKPVEKVTKVGTKRISVNPSQNKGLFTWPVPICGNMSRGFGNGHAGLDICNGPVTVMNQPFVAAGSGTVVEASYGWNGGYGNIVRVDHGNGYSTVYAHCNSLAVSVGQKVNAGDMLGLIGNSGDSDGPHLHFEVRVNGTAVNPLSFF